MRVLRKTLSALCLLAGLVLASGVSAQTIQLRTGFVDSTDCGLLTNPAIDTLICLQTANSPTRVAGTLYVWNGSAWTPFITGSGISSLNGLAGTTQTFANDTNVTISSVGTTHTLGWTGQLAVARGGTGSSSASGARTNLGLVIGTDVQAQNSQLSALASTVGTGIYKITGVGTSGFAAYADVVSLFGGGSCGANFLKGDGTCAAGSVTETDPVVAAISGLVKSNGSSISAAVANTDYVTPTATLTALRGLTSAADKLPYFTGSGTAATTDFSAFGRTLVDDADAATARTTLGLGTMATVASPVPVANGGTASTTASAARTALGLAIGTDVQAFDSDLGALAANSTNGFWTRTGAGTGAARTITGVSGNISITDGAGASGNPTIDLGATAVQTDQTNTYGAFKQAFGAATLGLPAAAGATPAASEMIIDTTANKLKVNVGAASHNVAFEDGNIATATALASDPVGCTLANGEWIDDIAANGTSTCVRVITSQNSAPAPATVRYPGEINKDTRTYACATHAGLTYVGQTASGNFAAIASEADGYTTYSDGVSTAIPCGADTLTMRGSGGINFDAYNFTATFTNQPTNDGWEAISSSAGDTTQYLKVCGLLTGGDSKDLTCETIALNGTTQIASVTTTYDTIQTVRLCSTSACVANTTAAGTITVRKASNNNTIATIAPGSSKAANQSMYVVTLTSSLNINALTTDTQPDATADFVPTYDNSAGSNKKVKLENLGTQQIYFDAGAITTDGTNCAAPTEQTLNSGPKTWAFSCADSGSSVFYGKVRLPVAITTATFTLGLFHGTTESITFAGDFSAECRADATAINNTWGTSQSANVSITTANQYEEQTSAAVTPNGTCSKGAVLFWRYVVNAASFDTNAANSKVLGVTMKYQM